MSSKVDFDQKPNEPYDDYLVRSALEAEQESTKKGWLTTENVEASMAAHINDFFKKHKTQKAA